MQTRADKAKESFFDGTNAYYLTDVGRKQLQLLNFSKKYRKERKHMDAES